MRIKLDMTKSAQENANEYFEKAKELEKKAKGAEKAIEELKQKKEELAKSGASVKKLKVAKKKEWYEKYYWFFTSNGMLAIGGRNAQQNEELNAKYFEANDLFFHANVFGASAVILKNGRTASKAAKEEAAQFAACFSKAWENGQASVDVFAATREQVSKSTQKGYLGQGSFLITGEREWYRNIKLELVACVGQQKIEMSKEVEANAVLKLVPSSIILNAPDLSIMPKLAYEHSNATCKGVAIMPGRIKKSDAAKEISKRLGFEDIDYIMQHLPPGGFYIA